MNHFKRAFAISLSGIMLFLLLVFSFELINLSVEKSGFSSGKVLLFELEEKVFPRLRFLRFFIPPVIRIGFIIIGAVF